MSSDPRVPVREVCIGEQLLRPCKVYSANTQAEEPQLLLTVNLLLPNNTSRRAHVLIDTGAEENLVRMGFLPQHIFQRAKKPLTFVMANGGKLEGGTHTHSGVGSPI